MSEPKLDIDEEIDHEYTRDIVCPYCGHKIEDSCDYIDANGQYYEIGCPGCEETFLAMGEIKIDYSTEKLKNNK